MPPENEDYSNDGVIVPSGTFTCEITSPSISVKTVANQGMIEFKQGGSGHTIRTQGDFDNQGTIDSDGNLHFVSDSGQISNFGEIDIEDRLGLDAPNNQVLNAGEPKASDL